MSEENFFIPKNIPASNGVTSNTTSQNEEKAKIPLFRPNVVENNTLTTTSNTTTQNEEKVKIPLFKPNVVVENTPKENAQFNTKPVFQVKPQNQTTQMNGVAKPNPFNVKNNLDINQEETHTQKDKLTPQTLENLSVAELQLIIEKLEKIEQAITHAQNTGDTSQGEVLTQLKINALYLTKLDKEIKNIKYGEAKSSSNASHEEMMKLLRTNNLYISKLERKYEQITDKQSVGTDTERLLQDLLSHLRTNNLYISKLERKVDNLQTAPQAKENLDQEMLVNQLRSQTLQMSKVERRLQEIATSQQTGSTQPSNSDKQWQEQITQKIDQIATSQQDKQALPMDQFVREMQEHKSLMKNMEQNVLNKMDEVGKNQHPSPKMPVETENRSINSIVETLMETNRQIANLEYKFNELLGEQNNEVLLKTMKSSNLYITRLEQKIIELLAQLEPNNHL